MFTPEEIQAAIELRHELHCHPELRFKEFRTAERVAGLLEQKGYKVTRGIAGTGVVALLNTGRPGPVVALRADMDGLSTDLDAAFVVLDVDGAALRPGDRHDVVLTPALSASRLSTSMDSRSPFSSWTKHPWKPA